MIDARLLASYAKFLFLYMHYSILWRRPVFFYVTKWNHDDQTATKKEKKIVGF
jgi:hypothetical protein